MANAESFRGGNLPFFPLQGARARRDPDVRIATDSGDFDTGLTKPLTDAEENAVWSQYEAMPPSTDYMEFASNVRHRRWLIPAVLAASVAVGLAYAALSDKPAPIREPTLASQGIIQNPRGDAMNAAPVGAAPDDAAVKPQLFDSAQPALPNAKPATSPASRTDAVQKTTKRATPAKSPPPIVSEETPPPAPTYTRGSAPAANPAAPTPAPGPVPESAPLTTPNPAPGAIEQTPPMKTESMSPSQTVPAPESVPENAQSPQ